jgi:hypothetical protein
MTAPGLACGPCGTELPPNAKSYNGAVLPGPVDRLAAAPCNGSTGFLITVRQQPSHHVGAVNPVSSTMLWGYLAAENAT